MSEPTVEEFLASYSEQVQDIAERLRSLVIETIPDPVEKVYTGWKNISYGLGEQASQQVCYIAPRATSVNLGFPNGAQLPDPEGILLGSGKRMRHVKISGPDQIEDAPLRALIKSAMADVKSQ